MLYLQQRRGGDAAGRLLRSLAASASLSSLLLRCNRVGCSLWRRLASTSAICVRQLPNATHVYFMPTSPTCFDRVSNNSVAVFWRVQYGRNLYRHCRFEFPRRDSKPKKRLRENRAIIHIKDNNTHGIALFSWSLLLGLGESSGESLDIVSIAFEIVCGPPCPACRPRQAWASSSPGPPRTPMFAFKVVGLRVVCNV